MNSANDTKKSKLKFGRNLKLTYSFYGLIKFKLEWDLIHNSNSKISKISSKRLILKPKIGIPFENEKWFSKEIRLCIYSYLHFKKLLSKISKLSKTERNLLTSGNEILDQERE